MEIRIVLDQVEPPSGRLQVLSSERRGPVPGATNGEETLHGFTGWLGLIRSLEEAMRQGRARRDTL
jgi:hypothetical protein